MSRVRPRLAPAPVFARLLESEADRIVLGSDRPFPPMDCDPLAGVRAAGFDPHEVMLIADGNPRRLLRL